MTYRELTLIFEMSGDFFGVSIGGIRWIKSAQRSRASRVLTTFFGCAPPALGDPDARRA